MGTTSSASAAINPIDEEVRSVSSGESKISMFSRSSAASLFRRKKKVVVDDSYRDPPIPFMGKPVVYSIMTDRFQKAKQASANIYEHVQRDVADAITEARVIPVSNETERVRISSDVQDRIALRRTKRDIRYNVNANLLDIQRSLLYRKHMLNMM